MQNTAAEALFPTPLVLAVRSWGMRDSTAHIHRKKTYTYRLTYLAKGEIEFICGSDRFPCRAGDIFFCRREHSMRRISSATFFS